MSHSWFSDKSLKRYFTEAIYRDDVPHALRYIVLAIYRRNDTSFERDIAGKLRYLVDFSFLKCQENERYIGDISEEQSAINEDNRRRYFCTAL